MKTFKIQTYSAGNWVGEYENKQEAEKAAMDADYMYAHGNHVQVYAEEVQDWQLGSLANAEKFGLNKINVLEIIGKGNPASERKNTLGSDGYFRVWTREVEWDGNTKEPEQKRVHFSEYAGIK